MLLILNVHLEAYNILGKAYVHCRRPEEEQNITWMSQFGADRICLFHLVELLDAETSSQRGADNALDSRHRTYILNCSKSSR